MTDARPPIRTSSAPRRSTWRMAVSSAAVLATVLGSAVAIAGPASADVPALTVSDISVSQVPQGTTTTIPGLAFSGASDSTVLQVTVSTDVGTLTVPTPTNLTLAYGYSSWSGATISFTGLEADVNTALDGLQMLAGNNRGTTAHVSANAFRQRANLVYSPTNKHFYQYFPSTNISWSDANTAAPTQSYGGLTGYLATIPNDAVNTFIANNIQGAANIWFGARSDYSDSTYPRLWKWSGGPLAGQTVSACSATTLRCDFATGTNGLNGNAYSHWASGEPNNYGYSSSVSGSGENAAVTNWSGSHGNWNDLSDSATGIGGYLVEYGDLATGSTNPVVGVASTTDDIAIYGPPAAPPTVPTAVKASVTAPLTMKIVTESQRLPVICKLTVRKIGSCSVQLVYKNSVGSYLVGTGSFRTTGSGTAGQVTMAVTITPLGRYLAYFHAVPSWVYASVTPYGSRVPLAATAHTSFVNDHGRS